MPTAHTTGENAQELPCLAEFLLPMGYQGAGRVSPLSKLPQEGIRHFQGDLKKMQGELYGPNSPVKEMN